MSFAFGGVGWPFGTRRSAVFCICIGHRIEILIYEFDERKLGATRIRSGGQFRRCLIDYWFRIACLTHSRIRRQLSDAVEAICFPRISSAAIYPRKWVAFCQFPLTCHQPVRSHRLRAVLAQFSTENDVFGIATGSSHALAFNFNEFQNVLDRQTRAPSIKWGNHAYGSVECAMCGIVNSTRNDNDDGDDDNNLNYRHRPDHTINTLEIDTRLQAQCRATMILRHALLWFSLCPSSAQQIIEKQQQQRKWRKKNRKMLSFSVIIYRKPFAFSHWHCLSILFWQWCCRWCALYLGLCLCAPKKQKQNIVIYYL